jgi:hypothetical protein
MVIHPQVMTFAQGSQSPNSVQAKYMVVQTNRSERFVIPYTAANDDRIHPLVYTFGKPISESWILNIQNNLSYAFRPDAKVVIKLQEPVPSEKFIEIAMYGDVASKRVWAAVNTKEAGFVRVYDNYKNGVPGWSTRDPIIIGYDSNSGLTINSGTKVLVDQLSVNGFILGSIAIYGKDDTSSPINTYTGNISFEALYGNPSASPIYYLPLGMVIGVGGVLGWFLLFKRRENISSH